ncbi:MAG: alcohol dehydrogenase catalytic domain-containing protein [Halioglobus sp.]|nr:alcohol dehydrogenase catalytic domain-containing protein [Halioglobus sp.]
MTSIPQARIHGVDDLRLDSIAPPQCGDDDVVVEVRQCGICGTDLGYLAMGGITAPDVPMPIGHELWGVVSAAGANVSHVAPGDAVVVQPMSNGVNIGNGGLEGGFTPQLLVRDAALDPGSTLRLPPDIPLEWGALVEPLAVAQHGANRVGAAAEDKAVIYGAGPIGLCMVQVLSHRGLGDIAVVDLSDKRLEVAAQLGATALRGDDPQLADRLIELHGARSFFGMPLPASDIYFEATGVRAVFEGIVNMAGPQSRICLSGVHKEPASVDLVSLLAKEVSVIPAMGYDGEFDEVFAILRSGDVDPTVIVTHHFPLSDIQAAFAAARDTASAIKVMIDCQL